MAPEVNQGQKCKNAGSAAELEPNPPSEPTPQQQCNNQTEINPTRSGLFEPDVLFVVDGGTAGLTKGITMFKDTLCFQNNDVCSPFYSFGL
jgi:hypothetical protein